jgi:transcriptional regulator with XRE-family HTH domain
MREASDLNIKDPVKAARAADLRRRIKAAGLTIAEFMRRSGLSRNIVYALSKGREATPGETERINRVLPK